eukprot:2805845-Pyramimonas_sp.AAC.1
MLWSTRAPRAGGRERPPSGWTGRWQRSRSSDKEHKHLYRHLSLVAAAGFASKSGSERSPGEVRGAASKSNNLHPHEVSQ